MKASYPVDRYGILLQASELVLPATAEEICDLIRAEASSYYEAFVSATVSAGALRHRRAQDENVLQQIPERRIFDFPAAVFSFGPYRIKARNSLTVCIGSRQSKMWTRLTLLKLDGQRAEGLSISAIQNFFKVSGRLADAAIRGMLTTYRGQLKRAGISLNRAEGEYAFRFRAFNSQDERVGTLYDELVNGKRLSEAAREKSYQEPILGFLGIVLDRDPKDIKTEVAVKKITQGDFDFFGYESLGNEDFKAVFAAHTDDELTELCGFGLERRTGPKNELLAHATTGRLLEEYASQF